MGMGGPWTTQATLPDRLIEKALGHHREQHLTSTRLGPSIYHRSILANSRRRSLLTVIAIMISSQIDRGNERR